jgi:hypothetical protein
VISTSPTSRPILLGQIRAEARAQRLDPLRLRVAVVAGADRIDGGGFGDLRDIEIRQADREVDRVLHLRREVEDLADTGGIGRRGARRGDVVGGFSWVRRQGKVKGKVKEG